MIDQKLAPYAATVLRLSLGIMFIAHALLKIAVFTPEGTAQFFNAVGLPSGLAYFTIAIELIGGIALVLGVYTRYVALALIPVLIGSIVFVHGSAGWLFSNENGGWEYSAFLIAASLTQAMLGNGAYALKFKQPATSPALTS